GQQLVSVLAQQLLADDAADGGAGKMEFLRTGAAGEGDGFLGQVFGFDGAVVFGPGAAGAMTGQVPGQYMKRFQQCGQHFIPDSLGHAQRMGEYQQGVGGLPQEAVADGTALVHAECHRFTLDLVFQCSYCEHLCCRRTFSVCCAGSSSTAVRSPGASWHALLRSTTPPAAPAAPLA